MNWTTAVIDVANLSYRNYFAGRWNWTREPPETPVIHGLLRDMSYLERCLGITRFAFCFDGPGQLDRARIYPAYKASRLTNQNSLNVRVGMERLWDEVLPALGYRDCFRLEGCEADDLIALLVRGRGRWCMISSDSDLYQLLEGSRVTQYVPASKREITEEQIVARTGVCPHEWSLYKALTGCRSDGLGGVQGVGPVSGLEYLRKGIVPRMPPGQDFDEELAFWHRLTKLPFESVTDVTLRCRGGGPTSDTWDGVVSALGFPALCGKCPLQEAML